MSEENKPSAALATELKAAAAAVEPQRRALQAKIDELAKQVTPLCNEATRTSDGWRLEEEWELIWVAEENLYVERGSFDEDGIWFEVDYDSHLLPYEVLDNPDAAVAEGWALLSRIRSEVAAKKAQSVGAERERLLARLAEIDAEMKED
jgi:hypothetical protein